MFSFSTENWSRPRAEVEGLMRCSPSGSTARRRSSTTRGCGCASSAGARGSRRDLVERMDWAEAMTARNRADHPLRRLQLRRQGGDRRCGAKLSRGLRGRVPRAPLRARDARPRPADPDQRRAADLELPALAVAPTPSSSSATSCGRTSAATPSSPRSRSSSAGGAGSGGARDGGIAALRLRGRLRAAPTAPAGAPAAALGRAPPAQASRPAPRRLGDDRADRLGAALDCDRGHDRGRRRRAVRRRDDRLRLRRGVRALADERGRAPVHPRRLRGGPRRSWWPPSTARSFR